MTTATSQKDKKKNSVSEQIVMTVQEETVTLEQASQATEHLTG
jgi:hypothetical protein